MTEQKISPGLVIVGGLGLGLAAAVGVFALTLAARPEVEYLIGELSNQPFGSGGIAMRQPEEYRTVFDEGEIVVLEAVPREGYQFTGWLLDGVPWSTANPLTFTMNRATMSPEEPHSIIATYVPVTVM